MVIDRRIATIVDKVPRFINHAHLVGKRGTQQTRRVDWGDRPDRRGNELPSCRATWGKIQARKKPVSAPCNGRHLRTGGNVCMQSAALTRQVRGGWLLLKCCLGRTSRWSCWRRHEVRICLKIEVEYAQMARLSWWRRQWPGPAGRVGCCWAFMLGPMGEQ